jgi:hypothetical protein
MTNKVKAIKELKKIPGVGKSIAEDLWNIGIRKIEDLKGQYPELLYDLSNIHAGIKQDRCLLYVYRCAVYFADTGESGREPSKLQWWHWKDKK